MIADQAKTLERVTAELRWHGLDDEALTVAQGFEIYARARQGEKAWRKYRERMQPMLRELGALPCLQVTAARWGEHRAKRATQPCGRYLQIPHPSSTTLDLELGDAKSMFRWLVGEGHISRNPLEMAKRANEPTGRETYLEFPDVERLVAGADVLLTDGRGHKNERRVLLFRAFVLAKFAFGLRISEVLQLRRDRIDANGVTELSAKRTKSKRRRTVALTPAAVAAIHAVPQLGGDPRVFTVPHNHSGPPAGIGQSTIRAWWHEVATKTGVAGCAFEGERLVPHVLRHSAASHAEAQGAHPTDIRDMLGHASLATTERYLHRRPAQRAVAMAALMERRGPQSASRSEP